MFKDFNTFQKENEALYYYTIDIKYKNMNTDRHKIQFLSNLKIYVCNTNCDSEKYFKIEFHGSLNEEELENICFNFLSFHFCVLPLISQ